MQEKYKHLKCQLCGTFNNLTTTPVQIPIVAHTDKYNRLVDPFLDYLQITVCRECFKKVVPVHAATFASGSNLWFENFVSLNDKQKLETLTGESARAINNACTEASAGLATANHKPTDATDTKGIYPEPTNTNNVSKRLSAYIKEESPTKSDNRPSVTLGDESSAKLETATTEEVLSVHDEIKERNKQAYKRLAEYLELIKEEK